MTCYIEGKKEAEGDTYSTKRIRPKLTYSSYPGKFLRFLNLCSYYEDYNAIDL